MRGWVGLEKRGGFVCGCIGSGGDMQVTVKVCDGTTSRYRSMMCRECSSEYE